MYTGGCRPDSARRCIRAFRTCRRSTARLPLHSCAFSEFDDSPEALAKYDKISFRDLCTKLGVSRRMYKETFEPMILTGLFAPGEECSAAAALGMAYFFVLKHQTSFDVRWCKGNIGEKIFQPWVEQMKERGVQFLPSTRVTDFECGSDGRIECVVCRTTGGSPLVPGGTPTEDASGAPADSKVRVEADDVVLAVGAAALNGMVRGSRALSQHAEWRRYANHASNSDAIYMRSFWFIDERSRRLTRLLTRLID
ncbi:hypothetical protein EMIHUDRAFT_248539 [Emiliania huxleyi CCMP1516]|uniref:Uncharacterized protein n=2 Tax=Emiliania huxleyi TaxID=2903 RepID=A0A0D3IFS6_EMIH1|nr:hypothetical protein EMIHUDRAFT_248539 [Emiliania huxleyi CCMP1516]EOD10111.1 hypothetical protein EMIHUDRAFT_248539 [Emiliania huxleyi CCMP1516]|eukprot:XP_005762540.1 hypothetical protein EMIHUDRAFT_248539 [Emiliania huxleyi CCMP1516]